MSIIKLISNVFLEMQLIFNDECESKYHWSLEDLYYIKDNFYCFIDEHENRLMCPNCARHAINLDMALNVIADTIEECQEKAVHKFVFDKY
jgi:hypothetical protein